MSLNQRVCRPHLASKARHRYERIPRGLEAQNKIQSRVDYTEFTNTLKNLLESYNVFESKYEVEQRINALANLNFIYDEWMRQYSEAKFGITTEMAKNFVGQMYLLGSFSLCVHFKGSDLDVLCLAPGHIQHADFFNSFYPFLKVQPNVTKCISLQNAYVPIIKMKFEGFDIDLLFATLPVLEFPRNFNFMNDDILHSLDFLSLRSLNGLRVIAKLIQLVPNVDNFVWTLRAIKWWAKRSGIYSNKMGYFGGITWTMLVARTCQLYPYASIPTLINKFFLDFANWNWPEPVYVNVTDPTPTFPSSTADLHYLMPVITPVFPQQNSALRVTNSTKRIIVEELKRGLFITNNIFDGLAPWDFLFDSPNFFFSYDKFLLLIVNATTSMSKLNACSFLSSNMCNLIVTLETMPEITKIHVNPTCYSKRHIQKNLDKSSIYFIALEFKSDVQLQYADLMQNVSNFKADVYRRVKDVLIDSKIVEHKDLSQYLKPKLLENLQKKTSRAQYFINILEHLK